MNRGVEIPSTPTVPEPLSVKPSSSGTVTVTLIGAVVVKLPGRLPITSRPAWTCVVTRATRLSSPRTTTRCFPPTETVTLLLPASSTLVKAGTVRT